jgi:hypothetical protein
MTQYESSNIIETSSYSGQTYYITADGINWRYEADAIKWRKWVDTCIEHGEADLTEDDEYGITVEWSKTVPGRAIGFITNKDSNRWGAEHMNHAIVNATVLLDKSARISPEFSVLFTGTEWAELGGQSEGG